MKKLLTLILLLSSLTGISQALRTVDTTINTWKAIITYPAGYVTEADRFYPMIIFFPGAGEAGGTYAQLRTYGPHARITGGWDGTETIGNGVHKFIIVSLSQSPSFDVNSNARTRVNTLLSFLRVKSDGVILTGLSAGGHCAGIMATEDAFDNTAPYGPFPFADGISAIISIQGVQPDDNADYLNKFKNYARNNRAGRYLGIWGTADADRQMPLIQSSMNAAVANSAVVISTANGHNATAFNASYGSSGGAAPLNYTLDGISQNIYKWGLRQVDTTQYVANSVISNAGVDQNLYLPTTSVTLTGSGTSGITPYSYLWTNVSGPNTPTIVSPTSATTSVTGLILGTYTFRLRVTDNAATVSNDEVVVTLNYSNLELSVTSNSPTTILTSASLTSSLSPNHNITSTKWTKLSAPNQTQKKLVFIGSSTTAGFGSTGYVSGTTSDSSYVGRVLKYYNDLGMLTTTAGVNLGQSTTDIYQAQPSWYVPPVGRNLPLAGRNITAALALNPDVIIVNYPSNSYDFLTVTETMAAFRRIKATVDSANKIVFFTTCQPRTGFSPSEELKLIQFSDSIRAQFPNNYIEFYYPLADETNPQAFTPAYDFGDGVHTNDAGHRQLARQVIATNVFKSFVTSGTAISTPTTTNTNVTGLTVGQHKFQVSIQDARGLAASSTSTATMVASTCNENTPVVYTINTTGPNEIYRPNGSAWKGGDTIKITGTGYNLIEFFNIRGDACRPIIIMPLTTTTTRQFRLKGNSSYIKIWGGPTQYGLKIQADPLLNLGAGLSLERVHHVEADNIEISGQDVGVSFKENVVYADTLTWYPKYIMQKFKFTNIWVHDIDGEGFYIGNTLPNGYTVTSPYTGDTVIVGNRIDSVEISNSLVERTTWDGIQLSNARNGNKIFNNVVRNFGTLDLDGQRAGIILGSNTNGDVYNNIVENGTGNGIQVFGYGSIKLYGNTVTNVGNTTNNVNGEQSIYGSDYVTLPESNPLQAVEIYNNQINQPKLRGAITFFESNNRAENINVHDNKFCIPSATGSWQSTYLTLPPVPINVNNVLYCISIISNKIRTLIKFKQVQ